MQPITNPGVPYVGPLQGGLREGAILRIQGHVPSTADRFNINLHCGPPPSDVALHLSVRLLQNYIARNSLQEGAWGNEEGDGSLPISPDQGFEILILCDRQCFKIAINGNHFCEFNHRVPFRQVNFLEVDGDVALKLISLEDGSSAPPPPMGGPDYSANYGRPPNQYGPSGPYDSGPYDSLQGGPPRPEYTSSSKTLLNQPPTPINMPQLSTGVPPMGMPLPTYVPLPPHQMPMPSHVPLHSPNISNLSSAPLPAYVMPMPVPGGYPIQPPPMSYGQPQSTGYGQQPPMGYGQPPPIRYEQTSPMGYGKPPPVYYGQPSPMGYGQQPPIGYGQPAPYMVNQGVPYDKETDKKMKKRLKKAAKYGIPIAAAGVGAYALSRALHRSSSSSSSD